MLTNTAHRRHAQPAAAAAFRGSECLGERVTSKSQTSLTAQAQTQVTHGHLLRCHVITL
jgi:hypothetical protein